MIFFCFSVKRAELRYILEVRAWWNNISSFFFCKMGGGAHVSFPECLGTILEWNELKWLELYSRDAWADTVKKGRRGSSSSAVEMCRHCRNRRSSLPWLNWITVADGATSSQRDLTFLSDTLWKKLTYIYIFFLVTLRLCSHHQYVSRTSSSVPASLWGCEFVKVVHSDFKIFRFFKVLP